MTVAVVGTLLAAASVACADIGSAVSISDASPSAAGAGAAWGMPSSSDLHTSTPVMPRPDAPESVSEAAAAEVVLRADPSSAALCFTALFGLGAWQVGKSFRRFNLACVPEWYHTGGPARIGPATPLDPSFAVLPAEVDGTLSIKDPLGEPCPHVQRLRQQVYTSIRCPRAPPV